MLIQTCNLHTRQFAFIPRPLTGSAARDKKERDASSPGRSTEVEKRNFAKWVSRRPPAYFADPVAAAPGLKTYARTHALIFRGYRDAAPPESGVASLMRLRGAPPTHVEN